MQDTAVQTNPEMSDPADMQDAAVQTVPEMSNPANMQDAAVRTDLKISDPADPADGALAAELSETSLAADSGGIDWISSASWALVPAIAGGAIMCGGVPLLLGAIGFSPAGPVAGAWAAAWASSITVANGIGVPAGSLYAILQSTAMTEALTGSQSAAACVLGGGSVAWFVRSHWGRRGQERGKSD